MIEDNRIKEYQYLKQLKEYMENAPHHYLDDKDNFFIYPKQLEIHLPGNRQKACNLACQHCFGTFYKKDLGRWEVEGLKLLHSLEGIIPYHIYGGAYTEPTMNSFLFPYLATTKHYGNHFGLHTNAVNLKYLQEQNSFLDNLHEISTDRQDYISISLDAGSAASWKKLKRGKKSDFYDILNSIEYMASLRKDNNNHAIRIVYLASELTAFEEEFAFIVSFARNAGIDSVRFSIPYDYYNKSFEEVKEYKENIENTLESEIEGYVYKYTSKNQDESPYIFWNPPYFTDIDRFNFEKCYYGYFQITLAADGFIYPCSAVASPTAKHLRKGEITSNLNQFNKMVWELQNNNVRCKKDCFSHGLRCNRMGLEINERMNTI